MAKVKFSLFELSGKLGNVVFVNNKTHGAYVRAPRGTYKKAIINETLQKNAGKAKSVTATAGHIYRALIQSCGAFRQKNLWQMMLKRMYKASSTNASELLKSLAGLELHETYPYSRIVLNQTAQTSVQENTLTVTLSQTETVLFAQALHAEIYRYQVHVLWFGSECPWLSSTKERTQWTGCGEPGPSFIFSFPVPEGAMYYLLVMEVQGGRERRRIEAMKATGMQILLAGSLAL